ncbi:MAG: glycosyltransferase family 4 protein [bacterium]|nr:glycosyltransferase family 4 protein [bacterium]
MSERPVRVAMIGQKGYPPIHGGIEKHVAELAARLGPMNIGVDIYSRPHYSSESGPCDLQRVKIIKLPSLPTKHFDAISHTIACTTDALFRKVDVVHYHALGPGLLSGIPRWLAGKKTVVTVHGLDWQRDKWGSFATQVLQLGESASVNLPDRTIVVSKALRKHYLDAHKRPTDYIPNGIVPPVYRTPELLLKQGIDGPFVLFVGRLVPEKGCHLLLDAWGNLPGTIRNRFKLVIAGDAGFTPGYVDKLKAMAPAGVEFLGYIHGPLLDELYTNAEMLVLPSTLEGLSITLLEGLSYARCCLVSDIPPNVEAAGGNAVLFKSGDHNDLTAKLTSLLNDPEKRETLGAAGQIHAIEHYSWDRVTKLTAELYREIVD